MHRYINIGSSAVFPSWQVESMIHDMGIVNWVEIKKFKIRAVRVYIYI